MNKFFKIVLTVVSVLYPFAILAGFLWLKASPKVLVLGLVAIAIVYFLANSNDNKEGGLKRLQFWIMISAVTTLAGVTFYTESARLLKLYPVIMNMFLLVSFGFTLIKGPSMIFRLARIKDSSIDEMTGSQKDKIERYCRIVTWIWCIFFTSNGSVAVFTAFLANDVVWSVYNGFFAYVMLGLLLVGEILYRKLILKT